MQDPFCLVVHITGDFTALLMPAVSPVKKAWSLSNSSPWPLLARHSFSLLPLPSRSPPTPSHSPLPSFHPQTMCFFFFFCPPNPPLSALCHGESIICFLCFIFFHLISCVLLHSTLLFHTHHTLSFFLIVICKKEKNNFIWLCDKIATTTFVIFFFIIFFLSFMDLTSLKTILEMEQNNYSYNLKQCLKFFF